MKNSINLGIAILFIVSNHLAIGQKSIKEYVSKYSSKQIQKGMLYDAFTIPATHKSFKDGHGKNPYFTSREQLPDTIALITFNIRDLGDVNVSDAGYYSITTYNYITSAGGNKITNEIYELSIGKLKERFRQEGVVLLTPKEFLNTQEKIDYYYDEFTPEVTKLGKFLSRIENRGTQMSTSADYFRTFDLSAAFDSKRSISLGSDLANHLGVDAVLSIGTVIQSNKKEAYIKSVVMAMNGPNPVPKEDKKYVAQKVGNGYNEGQLYAGLHYNFKKPIKTITIHKKQITDTNFDGIEVILDEMVVKMYDFIYTAIEKTQK